MPTAVIRGVPDSFVQALTMGEKPFLDADRAREQHFRYRQMLAGAGYQVSVVAADEDCPDCPFIEDAAVVLDTFAVATRPGAPERQPEVGPVAEALARMMPVAELTDPATLDGGDVLRMGKILFVGKSARTNTEGIRQLAALAADDGLRVIAAPLTGVLHLKTAILGLDDETILIASQYTDPAVYVGHRLIEKPPGRVAGQRSETPRRPGGGHRQHATDHGCGLGGRLRCRVVRRLGVPEGRRRPDLPVASLD
jgi:dimethylargininase